MNNKYKNWYNSIITKAKTRVNSGYTETHHIIPRSLGGDNSKDNLVELSAREHFICHILLTKFIIGDDKYKMINAVMMMKSSNKFQNRYINSRLYENVKVLFAIYQKENMTGEGNHFYGRTHSKETKLKMSESKKKLLESSWINPHIGMKRSIDCKLKMKKSKEGMRHWTNGILSIKSKEAPTPEWHIGRVASINFKKSVQDKIKIKERLGDGRCNWWNDGLNNKRCKEAPGLEWRRGRLFSSPLYNKFCKKL